MQLQSLTQTSLQSSVISNLLSIYFKLILPFSVIEKFLRKIKNHFFSGIHLISFACKSDDNFRANTKR